MTPLESNLYSLPELVLRKWSERQLQVEVDNGKIRCVFLASGSACSSNSQDFRIEFQLDLKRCSDVQLHVSNSCYRIQHSEGSMAQCSSLDSGNHCIQDNEFIGMRLDDLVPFPFPLAPSGCLCTPAYRMHKWRNVIETVHYTLHNPPYSIPVLLSMIDKSSPIDL